MKLKLVLVFMLICLAPALAMADSVEGTVAGFTCVTQGRVCPVGREDPMIAVERVFVVHVKGEDYYFVPNVDRAILARHLNQRVKVEGHMSARFKAIKAQDIYVLKDGKWKKTWSQNWQDEIYRGITSGYPLGGA